MNSDICRSITLASQVKKHQVTVKVSTVLKHFIDCRWIILWLFKKKLKYFAMCVFVSLKIVNGRSLFVTSLYLD